MKAITKITIAALFIGSFALESCKKGENDPFLSLRSRKARFAGEWTYSAGSGSNTSGSNTTNWTYDGAVETTTPGNFTDKYTQTYTIEKDGTFTSVYTDNNTSTAVVTTYTGTWNFLGGVGDVKNKSSVVMHMLTITSGSTTVTYTGDNAPTSIMDIDQLKNKEIIIISKGSTSLPASSNEGTMTWTAK